MKITVEFLSLPNVVKMIGSKSVVLDFSGTTVNDLVREVAEKYGRDVQKFLLDETGNLDMTPGADDQQAGMDSPQPDGQTTAGRRPGNHPDDGRRRINALRTIDD